MSYPLCDDEDMLDRLREAQEAWVAAKEAIVAAWKLLPQEILKNRSPVPRGLPNQSLSYHGADEMVKHLEQAINSVLIKRRSTPDGSADKEAVRERYAGCGASEKRQ